MTFFRRQLAPLAKLWIYLTGTREEFELESRIFHNVILGGILFIIINYISDSYFGFTNIFFPTAIFILYYFAILYVSRFLKKTIFCIVLDGILFNVFLAVSYFSNDGINGPTLLNFLISFVGLATYAPKKFFVFLLSFNVITALALQTSEYHLPRWVTHTYHNVLERHIDLSITYLCGIFLIYLCIYVLRRSYHFENTLAEYKAEQLALANAEKTKLFSILAHDLRTPLTQINHYLELLSNVEVDTATRLKLERGLNNTTDNTHLILTNLLSWSKKQLDTDGKIILVQVNLSSIVKQVSAGIKLAAEIKNIPIEIDIDPHITILADEDYLQIIIRNLIQNAVKFTPKNGLIKIQTAIENDECILTVTDNGIGIPQDMQAEIFSLKVQSTYGTEMEKGVGLGMMLSKDLTLLQNGRIWFESTPGEGTIFYLAFKIC